MKFTTIRQLTLQIDGVDKVIDLIISGFEGRHPGLYCCYYSLPHFGLVDRFTYGADEVQAFLSCLAAALDEIHSLEKDQGIRLYWLEPGDQCGLAAARRLD